MDIEELNRSQIILLTLLVSFVTSIATGIVTVSLMEQAPPAFTQTVNRVVERTVEKVVPSGQVAAVTTEKTVVVKESDLIAEAVKKIAPSIVQIHSVISEPVFLGLGIVLDDSGTVITDSSVVLSAGEITVTPSGGTPIPATIASRDDLNGIAILKAETTTAAGVPFKFTPATLSVGAPSLGQTIVVLSGNNISRIADGIVTALIPQGEGKDPVVDTNISADFIMGGSALINTEGGLVGVSTAVSRTTSAGAFLPSSQIVPSLSAPQANAGE